VLFKEQTVANHEMSRKEAEHWLSELIADPGRMSAKMFREGYEASLRTSGIAEAEINLLLRNARQVYDELLENEADDVVGDETGDVDWEGLEVLISETKFDPEDIHYKAAALHQVRQLNRCMAALKRPLH
jgi:hypothetical protein